MNILFKIAKKVDGWTQPWNPMELWSRGQVVGLKLLQLGEPGSVFTLTTLTAMVEVVVVSNRNFLRLIPDQTNASSDLGSDRTFKSALAEKAVNSLNFVPP